ncbi:MAG: hypothetical protein ACRCUY_11075 [Thermoguttaceae bacterium]
MTESKCPICELRANYDNTQDERLYDCPKCGLYVLGNCWLGESHANVFREYLDIDDNNRTRFSYFIATHQANNEISSYPKIASVDLVHHIHRDPLRVAEYPGLSLPTPKEQADLLILHLGKFRAGEVCNTKCCRVEAIIGAASRNQFHFICQTLIDDGFVLRLPNVGGINSARAEDATINLRLTMRGWERYEELKRGKISGTKAFMAMKFVDENDPLHAMFQTHFKKAVAETGFELYRLDEDAKAGLIDNHLRVAIQTAAFVISDLTHDNSGAYWEAGYAEGLGKPVIYTCRKSEDENIKTHFDTNHHTTIFWESEKPEKAVENLKATIRNSLPLLAKMED